MVMCDTCKKRVLSHSRHIVCCKCCSIFHIKCLHLVDVNSSIYINRHSDTWFCESCISEVFPFNHLFDDTDFYDAIASEYDVNHSNSIRLCDNVFRLFDLEENLSSPFHDIDPDINYYQGTNPHLKPLSNYSREAKFNSTIKESNISDDSLSLLHTNIRSISKNFNSLKSYLLCLCLQFSIIGITETWLRYTNKEFCHLPDYKFISSCRDSHKRGGGVAFFVKKSLNFIVRHDLTINTEEAEMLFIQFDKTIFNTNQNVVIGVVYRPPSTNIDKFNKKINKTLKTIDTKNNIVHIMGDFNIDLLKRETHDDTDHFLNIMYTHSLLPNINKPTRITHKTATLIDNIFSSINCSNDTDLSGILVTDISDHYPIYHINNKVIIKPSSNRITKRDFSQRNIQNFSSQVQQTDWTPTLNSNNPQESFSYIYNSINSHFNTCFPVISFKAGYRSKKPWLSAGLKNSIAKKNWLYSLSITNRFLDDEYKAYKNKLTKILRKAEKDYYENLINQNKNNLKKSWLIIKEVLNKRKSSSTQREFSINDNKTSDPMAIANHFNNFFTNIGPNLASKLPKSNINPTQFLNPPVTSTFYTTPVSEHDILLILSNLKESSPGPDELPPKLLKQLANIIKTPLTHSINLSLQHGYFPNELKVAKVVPIFKSGDPMLVSNYRPVSVLNSFSKVYEKAFYNQLTSYISQNNLLYNYQFGFRPAHSTNLALTLLTDKIIEAIDNKEFMVGVFLDFSKAFDTVNHNILLDKLFHYGVQGTALDWTRSYLSSRTQYVSYNNTNSSKLNCICGVPQGSILGPLFFLLYINDIINISHKLFIVLFADDSNAFYSGKNLVDIINTINSELNTLSSWLTANKLTINVKKTHYIIFATSKVTQVHPDIIINNQNIDRVSSTRFLGVVIDETLKFKEHITHIKSKAAKGVGILCQAKKFFNIKTLVDLYYAFIHPYLSYCVEIWGNTHSTYLDPLVKLQKRAIRIITGSKRTASSDGLFKLLRIVKFNKLHTLSIYIFLYKLINNIVPNSINELFCFHSDVHSHATRNSNNLYKKSIGSAGERGLRFHATCIYNCDDTPLYNQSYIVFKAMIKSRLIDD